MLQPHTFGTHRTGSALLVHCEQGYGDTIQFARFLPLLADAGYRVIVSCQSQLATLVATINGVSQVVVHGAPLPVCDLQVLLLSIPYIVSTTLETLPAYIPYLIPQSQLIDVWQARLDNYFVSSRKKN